MSRRLNQNLGNVQGDLGGLNQASEHFKRAFEIQLKTLGPDPGKSRFTATNEITIHEFKKLTISQITGKNRPFTNHENTLDNPQ